MIMISLLRIEAYKRVDDKLVAALSKEFGWNEIQADPYVIEASKHDIVEVMMADTG